MSGAGEDANVLGRFLDAPEAAALAQVGQQELGHGANATLGGASEVGQLMCAESEASTDGSLPTRDPTVTIAGTADAKIPTYQPADPVAE